MRVFKYKKFNRWCKSESISDSVLKSAILELEQGLFDRKLAKYYLNLTELQLQILIKNGELIGVL